MTDDIDPTPTPESPLSDWRTKATAHEALVAAVFEANKKVLFDRMAAAGISRAYATFDGQGDSGQIESIAALSGDEMVDLPSDEIAFSVAVWGRPKPETRIAPVADLIEELVYDLLGRTHDGWQDNEGAWGEFVFHVAIRTITLEFQQRYVSCDTCSHEF